MADAGNPGQIKNPGTATINQTSAKEPQVSPDPPAAVTPDVRAAAPDSALGEPAAASEGGEPKAGGGGSGQAVADGVGEQKTAGSDSPTQSTAADPNAGKPARAYALGERLRTIERHPVLLFGTTSSGKSTILMSFISSLRQNAEVSMRLGDPIYPKGSSRQVEEKEFAQIFFERRAESFIHGREMLITTDTPFPLFIPIDIQRTRDDRPTKFAFLEGKGEWYEPNSRATGSLFQDFKDEVTDVLKFYDGPISAIFVAPCSSIDSERRRRDNDIALLGALTAYQRYRSRQDEDSLLFLLTKWDTYADPINSTLFGRMESDDVSRVLESQYPDSWREFQSMPRPLYNDRRFFMQYCAGHLVDEANRPPPAKQKHVFDRYPRTLLNWLYGNATREQTGKRATRERVLFPDVVSRDAVNARIWERVTSYIFAR